MQTKQQTVHNFLNKQAQTAHHTVSPETGTAAPGLFNTVMTAVVTTIQFIILAMPFAIAIAGFGGAFDALVK